MGGQQGMLCQSRNASYALQYHLCQHLYIVSVDIPYMTGSCVLIYLWAVYILRTYIH